MLGFLSTKSKPSSVVKANEIFFVSFPNKINDDEIKILCAKTSLEFAKKMKVNKVYLHTGKAIIKYDYKI